MRKIIFNSVVLELTKRCNFSCAHCMRGNAENVDIPFSVIDNLMDQTQRMEFLEFTGGEPTLNPRAITHTLDAVKARHIPVRQIRLVTNGALHSEAIVDAMQQWAEYIRPEWRFDGEKPILFCVSDDKYHRACHFLGESPAASLEWYKARLDNCATVKYAELRNVFPSGRGAALEERHQGELLGERPRQIELWEHGMECNCPEKARVPAPSEGEAVCCCTLFVTARGNAFRARNSLTHTEDSQTTKDCVCSLVEPHDLYESIREFNRRFAPCKVVCLQEVFGAIDQYFERVRDRRR